jgi:hypothetical protein
MKHFILILLLTLSTLAKAQTYNYYFGNLHAHTSYSDGNKDSVTSLLTTPAQAYNYAKASQHIDFYGVSEHNHYFAGMINKNNYHKGRNDAKAATINGTYVAMYGMEWGIISGGGHALIYGYDSLIGWDSNVYDVFVAQNDYVNLWKKVNKKEIAFAYLAHPTNTDYSGFYTTYQPEADSCIVGMAMRSGPAFSTNTTYSNPSTSTFLTQYHNALAKGYHLGVGIDHDTHNSVFGRSQEGRLVIIAPELTETALLEAMRKMRFYASDDWNVKVNFKLNSQPMGSIFTQSIAPSITVSVTDPDVGDNISSIQVFAGVPGSGSVATTLTTKNTASFTYAPTLANNATNYYYLKITQTDGDIVWTSPIWYTRKSTNTVLPPVANYYIATDSCIGQSIDFTDISTNNPTAWSWIATGANPSFSSLQNPTFTFGAAGTYDVYLTTSNSAGNSAPVLYSVVIDACGLTKLQAKNTSTIYLYPNPANNEVTIEINNINTTLILYNDLGIEVGTWQSNQAQHTMQLSTLNNGMYCIKTITENGIVALHKIIVQH